MAGNRGFTPEELEQLTEMFHKHDENKDGLVNRKELLQLIRSTDEDISPDDVEQAINEFDTNKDGALDYTEFMSLMTHLRSMDDE
ncbi:hypothetical protein KVV02_007496 [Mortierella alpina]|uniref:EF-hand domain-containing protein n=1 Tax=Mortierella alpina TaxID=64518 RepID=A0A9P8A6W7_MORAP|nr:hypothetical protein KVV02_007496 [Mortierella alpina]